ncbi:MAG: BamA/TamA family outer membrane protein [Planctomycetota bacterium]|jgi:hypothetical protein
MKIERRAGTRRLLAAAVAALALWLAEAGAALGEDEESAANSTPPAQESTEKEFTMPFLPIVSYSDETSALFGVMLVRPHRWKDSPEGARPNTIALSAFYTLRHQWGVGVMPSIYLDNEEYLLKPTAYIHKSPATFWGVGNEAGEEDDNEELFTAEGGGFWFTATKRVYEALRVGPSFRYGTATIAEKEEGGLLENGAVEGSDGGTISGAGIALEWDDRDSLYWPSSGGYYQASAEWYREFLGSDFEYEAFSFDLRQFFPLATDHVLGVQAKAKYMRGDPPFYALAWIGGPWMLRGLYEGRFRDKTMAAIQAESRFMIRPRFGGVVFIGVGEVAETYSDFSAENLRFAGGVGIRFTLDPKDRINLRIDVGVSEFGIAPVLLLTEAF